MTGPVVVELTAGRLAPEHIGRLVHVDLEKPVSGRLEAIDTPKTGVRTLTLGGRRYRNVSSACPVWVVIEEEK